MTLRVKDIPTSYEEAYKLVDNKYNQRKVSKNGFLYYVPINTFVDGIPPQDQIVLKLFKTAIVTWYKDGNIKLDYGYCPTKTTCAWLNAALGRIGHCYVGRDDDSYKHIYLHLTKFYPNSNAWLLPITLRKGKHY